MNNIDMNIYDYIVSQNKNLDNRIALSYFNRKFTFKEVIDNINKVMNSLQSFEVKEKDNVIYLGFATPEFVFLMYALAKMNVTLNILNPMDSSNYESIIKRLNPKLLFCYDKFYDEISEKIEKDKVIITSPFESLPYPFRFTNNLVSLLSNNNLNECMKYSDFIKRNGNTNKVYIKDNFIANSKIIEIGTGGSTGIPKLVGISNEMLNNVVYQHELMNENNAFDVSFNDNERFLDIIPPHLAYGICDIHLALSLRLNLCLEPNPNPKLFIKQLRKYKPHHVLAGPIHWKELISYDKKLDLSCLKNVVAGGEHLENSDEIETNRKLKLNNSNTTVKEGVGLTEICGVGTYNSSNFMFTVGRPLPNYQVGIFRCNIEEEHNDNIKNSDEIAKIFFEKQINGELKVKSLGTIGKDNQGEICYQLPVKILGYVGEEHKKEQENLIRRHEDGLEWIHTGDIGYINEDLNLVITDRIKRVFNRNGWKIYPTYLSKIVCDSNLIKECTIIKRKSINNGESYVPILYVVLKEDTINNREKLIYWCNEKLTNNYKLEDIIFLDELPKTTSGKINFNLVEKYDELNNVNGNNKKKILIKDFYTKE